MDVHKTKHILLIDDDEPLRELVTEYLKGYGFTVNTLPDGVKAVETVVAYPPDLIILDVMMPGPDGFEVLQKLRGHTQVPVIMLTAKGDDADRIVGLELGADDYLPKPFNPRELLARIRAVLRRTEPAAPVEARPARLEAGGLTLDLTRQELCVAGQRKELSYTEARLLATLMGRPDTIFSRDELMSLVWARDFEAYDRNIDVHISHLRAILKPYPEHSNRIRTIWGTGYLFVGAP